MNDQQYTETFAFLRREAERLEKAANGRVRGRPMKDTEMEPFRRQSFFHMQAIKKLSPAVRKSFIGKIKQNNAQLIKDLDMSHQLRAYTRRLRNPNWTIPKNLANSQRQCDKEKVARLKLIVLAFETLSKNGVKTTTKNVYQTMKNLDPNQKQVALDTLRKDIKSLKVARSSRSIN